MENDEPASKRRRLGWMSICARRKGISENDVVALHDPLFIAVRQRVNEPIYERGSSVGTTNLAPVVKLTGSTAAWLNGEYHLVSRSVVNEVLREDWSHMKLLGKDTVAGPWLYLGQIASTKGDASLPYMWYHEHNSEWKLATLGFSLSHFYCVVSPKTHPSKHDTWKIFEKATVQNAEYQNELGSANQIRVDAVLGASSSLKGAGEQEDKLFTTVRQEVCGRPGGASIAADFDPAVHVTGSRLRWLNQIYYSVERALVVDVLKSKRHGLFVQGDITAGPRLYLGRFASPRGAWCLPYFWYDRENKQWKLATLGISGSHFCSGLPVDATFPQELGEWRNLRQASDVLKQFPELQHKPVLLRVNEAPGHSIMNLSAGLTGHVSPHVLKFPPLLDHISLRSEDADAFFHEGYLVKRQAEFGTARFSTEALRAVHILVRDLHDTTQLRDINVRKNHPAWPACSAWLRESPDLWTLLARMLGADFAEPSVVQVAVAMPDGGFGEPFQGRADDRPGTDYHIDGHGRLPNNFALIVGCCLSDPPVESKSWGGYTVFPKSHKDSALHEAYMRRAREGGPRKDLGEGEQLRLTVGDVVIAHPFLAHRRAMNYGHLPRSMLFFRLKPKHQPPNWQDGMLQDPFTVLQGVAAQVRSASSLQNHVEDT